MLRESNARRPMVTDGIRIGHLGYTEDDVRWADEPCGGLAMEVEGKLPGGCIYVQIPSRK
jgi:hypothetical protein